MDAEAARAATAAAATVLLHSVVTFAPVLSLTPQVHRGQKMPIFVAAAAATEARTCKCYAASSVAETA